MASLQRTPRYRHRHPLPTLPRMDEIHFGLERIVVVGELLLVLLQAILCTIEGIWLARAGIGIDEVTLIVDIKLHDGTVGDDAGKLVLLQL